jgi:hypothetical protein
VLPRKYSGNKCQVNVGKKVSTLQVGYMLLDMHTPSIEDRLREEMMG